MFIQKKSITEVLAANILIRIPIVKTVSSGFCHDKNTGFTSFNFITFAVNIVNRRKPWSGKPSETKDSVFVFTQDVETT